MALMDIPSKLIERSETLIEAKMRISQEFTQFLYQHDEELLLNEENLVSTFRSIYKEIDAYIPQSDVAGISKIPRKKNDFFSYSWYIKPNNKLWFLLHIFKIIISRTTRIFDILEKQQ